jgi:hypothetical protein
VRALRARSRTSRAALTDAAAVAEAHVPRRRGCAHASRGNPSEN